MTINEGINTISETKIFSGDPEKGDHSVGLLPITAEDGRNGALTFVTAMSVLMGFTPPAHIL